MQKEQFHLLSYSYTTGSKARAGSPPQHLGDGGSFVGALEGSVGHRDRELGEHLP